MQNEDLENLDSYFTTKLLVEWAELNCFDTIRDKKDMTDENIVKIMRWIAERTFSTVFLIGEKPRVGRMGINNLLFCMMMEFPHQYEEWGLSQYN